MCVWLTAYSSKISVHIIPANPALAPLSTVLGDMNHHVQGVDDSSRPPIVPTPKLVKCLHPSIHPSIFTHSSLQKDELRPRKQS